MLIKICIYQKLIFLSILLLFVQNSRQELDSAGFVTIFTSSFGEVRGFSSDRYKTSQEESPVVNFYGIPYASIPNGRFTNSHPVHISNNTVIGDNRPRYCPNYYFMRHLASLKNVTEKRRVKSLISEDCLTIDVYVRQRSLNMDADILPVIVIFADPLSDFKSFLVGRSNMIQHLLQNVNAVLVRVNYRNGPLGFLRLSEAGYLGNYGLYDQSLALKWVQKEILNFGGDGNRVSILAEGSGAGGVYWHLKYSEELFDHLVVLSGSPSSVVKSLDNSKLDKIHKDYVSLFGCEKFKSFKYCFEELALDKIYLTNPKSQNLSVLLEFFGPVFRPTSQLNDVKPKNLLIGMDECDGVRFHGNYVNDSLKLMQLLNTSLPQENVQAAIFEYKHHNMNLQHPTIYKGLNKVLTDFLISAGAFMFSDLISTRFNQTLFMIGSQTDILPDCKMASAKSFLSASFLNWRLINNTFNEILNLNNGPSTSASGSIPSNRVSSYFSSSYVDQKRKTSHDCYIFNAVDTRTKTQVDEGVTKDESTWYPIFASNDIRDCEPHSSRFWNEVIFESLEKKEKNPNSDGNSDPKSKDDEVDETTIPTSFEATLTESKAASSLASSIVPSAHTVASDKSTARDREIFAGVPNSVLYAIVGALFGFLLAILIVTCCVLMRRRRNDSEVVRKVSKRAAQNCECVNGTQLRGPGNMKNGVGGDYFQPMMPSVHGANPRDQAAYLSCGHECSNNRLIPIQSQVVMDYDDIYGLNGALSSNYAEFNPPRGGQTSGQVGRSFSDVRSSRSQYMMLAPSVRSEGHTYTKPKKETQLTGDKHRHLSQPALVGDAVNRPDPTGYPWLRSTPRLPKHLTQAQAQQYRNPDEANPRRDISGAESPSVESSGYGGGDGSRSDEHHQHIANKPVAMSPNCLHRVVSNSFFAVPNSADDVMGMNSLTNKNQLVYSDLSSTDFTDALLDGNYQL